MIGLVGSCLDPQQLPILFLVSSSNKPWLLFRLLNTANKRLNGGLCEISGFVPIF